MSDHLPVLKVRLFGVLMNYTEEKNLPMLPTTFG